MAQCQAEHARSSINKQSDPFVARVENAIHDLPLHPLSNSGRGTPEGAPQSCNRDWEEKDVSRRATYEMLSGMVDRRVATRLSPLLAIR